MQINFHHITLTPYNTVFAYLRICDSYTKFRQMNRYFLHFTFSKLITKFGIFSIYLNRNIGVGAYTTLF